MSVRIAIQKTFAASLVFGLGGLAFAFEGIYYAVGSGLLSGDFFCFGGFACVSYYEFERSMLRLGVYLLIAGLVFVLASCLLLWRTSRMGREGQARVFHDRKQKRIILASALLALVLIVSFLAPVVPFTRRFPTVFTLDAFPTTHTCHKTNLTVSNPVDYSGFESPSQALFGVGNLVYVQCNVVTY